LVEGLNYAPACQRIHFVMSIAEKRGEHFVCMLSKLRGSVIGIEDCFAQVNGAFNSLHGASTCVRHLGYHISRPQHLAVADLISLIAARMSVNDAVDGARSAASECHRVAAL
jgi:hypothetical protein